MLRRIIMFLVRTYLTGVVRGGMRRVGSGMRNTFSIRNILGESVGMWWDMRKIR